MSDLLVAAMSAYAVVFVAELGDKSQLLALGFGARHGLRVVLIGLTIGYAVAGAVAALVGGLLGAALPERAVGLAAGALFLLFAVLAWRDLDDHDGATGHADDDTTRDGAVGSRHVVASIAVTITVAEFGDKTQLATAALAAQANPVAVWSGATAGVVSAGMLGAIAGRQIGRRLDRRHIQIASIALFAGFGVLLIAAAR